MSAIDDFRNAKDEFFRNDPHSPLTQDQRAAFKGLRYFPENPSLDLVVDLEPFQDRKRVSILTNTGDAQTFLRLGNFNFTVDAVPASLTVYANEHGFFLPFADAMAGEETYGAGRYLEPERLPDGRFHVNFNLAYNPYCAYNENWSCPITPQENRIKVPIRAGEMTFKSHMEAEGTSAS
jgi:uncharacterized protein (DUF1684 family)